MPLVTPLPSNYSSSEIAAALLPLFTTILFFHHYHAKFLPVSGRPDHSHTKETPIPTSVQTLKRQVRLNNFSCLLRGGHSLADLIVKGRIHIHTCKAPKSLLTLITLFTQPRSYGLINLVETFL